MIVPYLVPPAAIETRVPRGHHVAQDSRAPLATGRRKRLLSNIRYESLVDHYPRHQHPTRSHMTQDRGDLDVHTNAQNYTETWHRIGSCVPVELRSTSILQSRTPRSAPHRRSSPPKSPERIGRRATRTGSGRWSSDPRSCTVPSCRGRSMNPAEKQRSRLLFRLER